MCWAGWGRVLRCAILTAVVFACAVCSADIIYLQGGGVIVGRIVDRDEECLVVLMRGGARVTVSLERVVKVEEGEPEEIYKRKAAHIRSGDADAHFRLGLWCEKVRLLEQARDEFEKALVLDPNHQDARRKLGFLTASEPASPSMGIGEKAVEKVALGGAVEGRRRKELVSAAKVLLRRRRREILRLAGLTLDEATRRIIARWHKRWEKARLAVLHKVFVEKQPASKQELAAVRHAYNCLCIAFSRGLKTLLSMTREEAQKRLSELRRMKKRYEVAVKALKVLGGDVGCDEDVALAEAALLLVSGAERAKELWCRLRGWRLQMLVEVMAERIEEENKAVTWLSREERLLVELINRARRMMGRLPLVVDERLCRAARAHAREMRRLGYFSHISPTEGRATPLDRARMERFHGKVGENIFKGGGPEEALLAWLASDDHSRNMLGGWDPLVAADNESAEITGRCWNVLGVGADEAFVALFGVREHKGGGYVAPPSCR